jgi:hypothetical protein
MLLCVTGATAVLLLQILARALGGSVGPNPDGNFVLTIEQIQPTQRLQQFSQLHSAVQQALAADRGGSRSVAAGQAAGCSTATDASQQQAAAAAAAEVNDADAGAVADALESMSIASLANNNSSSNDDNNASSDTDAGITTAAAAVGSRAAVVAADGGCFRLIESHGDQVGVSMWFSYCYVTLL